MPEPTIIVTPERIYTPDERIIATPEPDSPRWRIYINNVWKDTADNKPIALSKIEDLAGVQRD